MDTVPTPWLRLPCSHSTWTPCPLAIDTVAIQRPHTAWWHGGRVPCPHGNCTYRVPMACVYHGHTVTIHLVWALYLCTIATRTAAVGPRYTDTVPTWYRYGGHTGAEISCFALKSLAPGISPTHPTSAAPAVMTEHRRQSVPSSVAFHHTQRGGTVAMYRVHTANVHTVWPRRACTVAPRRPYAPIVATRYVQSLYRHHANIVCTCRGAILHWHYGNTVHTVTVG